MSNDTIRVAHVIGQVCKGGVEAVVFNYYRFIDRTKVQFDFIIDEGSPCAVPDDIIALGCRVFKIPPYKHLRAYIKALAGMFADNGYVIVHSHMNTLSVFTLYAAKKAGVPVRIAHSHSTAGRGKGEFARNVIKYALRPFSRIYPTHFAGCSQYAGEWLFGRRFFREKGIVFHNTVDPVRFMFNEDLRNRKRREMGLEDVFVVGHVGRFMPQKNHSFLLDVFCEFHKICEKSALLLTGEGELLAETQEKAKTLGIGDSVFFLGNRDDVNELYSAMDVFVLPSLYEGLGIAAVESQFSGLMTIVSNRVPPEVSISDRVMFVGLNEKPGKWAELVWANKSSERDNVLFSQNAGRFDIKDEIVEYQRFVTDVYHLCK